MKKSSWNPKLYTATLEFNMSIKLAKAAYTIGEYSGRRVLGPTDPTDEAVKYENIFDVELKDAQGATIPIEVSSVTKKAIAPKQLQFEITISKDVEGGSLHFTNKNNGLLRGQSGPDNVFFKDETIPGIDATIGGASKTLEEINKFSGPTMKSATMLTMLVSLSSSIALVKIFQMMDYMLFFNVALPPIFAKFLEIFSTNFFNDFPNLLIMFVDDDCPEIKPKFQESDMSCQFLSNCGSLIFIMLLTFIFKLLLWMARTAVTSKEELMGKMGLLLNKIDSIFGYQFYLSLLDMFNLDFYLAIFLQLDNIEIRSGKSSLNIALALICLIAFMFIKLLVFFYSTRVALIHQEGSKSEKGYKKYYFNFLFLGENRRHDCFYAKHQVILNMLKDPVLGFALVFFYNSPLMQVGCAFFITLAYFLMEAIYKPDINKMENNKNILSFSVYTGCNTMFLILIFIGGGLTTDQNNKFIGWPLIFLVSVLILFNYFTSMREVYLVLKKKLKDRKERNKMKQVKEA